VCLIVFNPAGETDTLCQEITVCTLPTAAFSSVSGGMTITFTNESADATAWMWDFGDGSTSTNEDPVHPFAVDGTYEICLIALNDCGETDTVCQQTVIDQSGLSENTQLLLSVYPNPANDVLTIVFTTELQNAVLEITDLAGKVVQTETLSGKTVQVDVHTLAAGCYKARVLHTSGTAVLTLLKQ
jgi:PKD repeat protein